MAYNITVFLIISFSYLKIQRTTYFNLNKKFKILYEKRSFNNNKFELDVNIQNLEIFYTIICLINK